MGLVRKIREWQKKECEMITNNVGDIQDANRTMLRRVLGVGLICFGLLFLLTFCVDSYMVMRVPYAVIFTVLLAVFFLQRFLKRNATLSLLYGSYGILVGIAIFTSSFVTSDTLSALIVMFLFQIPIVILDKSWRISCIEVVLALLYILFAVNFKESALVIDECINVIAASTMGIVLGRYLRTAQIDNFDLKRQAIVRENTDSLTGLSNRRRLFQYMNESWAAGRENPVTGVIMADIDFFKRYNDSYGHQDGDECLKRVGDYLLAVGQKYPITFFRYGGEEFAGIAFQCSHQELCRICEEMVQGIWGLQIPHDAADLPFVTISAGMADFGAGTPLKYEELISRADIALYQAKKRGRNRSVPYDRDMEKV